MPASAVARLGEQVREDARVASDDIKNALHAAAPKTVARSSGGHVPIWGRMRSAHAPTVTRVEMAENARAATIRKASW
jgi:hypothetical protein